MEAVLLALFVTLAVGIAERRSSSLRDQPCTACQRTITWRSAGWVHKDTGQRWDPYTMDEWRRRWTAAVDYRAVELPHAAQTAWEES